MGLIARAFPHPLISLTVAVVWVLLVNSISLNTLVFAAILGLVVPLMTRAYWPDVPRVRRPFKIMAYGLLVLWDIVVANIEVARIILFMRNRDLRPAFITIPLHLRSPEAITVLAGTITMTPGTVSCDLSACGRALLVHCLHAPDSAGVIQQIRDRYENRLREIFE